MQIYRTRPYTAAARQGKLSAAKARQHRAKTKHACSHFLRTFHYASGMHALAAYPDAVARPLANTAQFINNFERT